MVHKVQNFDLHADRDRVLVFTVTDSVAVLTNLSGSTLSFAMSTKVSPFTPIFTKTSPAGGIVITDAVNGVFEVTIDDVDTTGLDGEFRYEVLMTDPAAKKATLVEGTIQISGSIH